MAARYDLHKEGINYTDQQLCAEGVTETGGYISPEDIIDLGKKALPGSESYERISAEISDSNYIAPYYFNDGFGNGHSGTIEYSLFNQNGTSKNLAVVAFGWCSNYFNMVRDLAGFGISSPDQRFVAVNFMGRGRSSRIPFARSIAMAKSGSYQPVGELFKDALDHSGLLNDADGIEVVAESEGHRLAMGAIASGLTVEKGTFIDGPGMLPMGFWGLTNGFRQYEDIHRLNYLKHSTDSIVEAALQEFLASKSQFRMLKGRVDNKMAFLQSLLHAKAMGYAGLEADTAAALKNIKGKALVISLENSEVTCHNAASQLLAELALKTIRPAEMVHRIGHGLTHSAFYSGPGARPKLCLS